MYIYMYTVCSQRPLTFSNGTLERFLYYIFSDTYTYINTHTHTYIHTYMHAYTQIYRKKIDPPLTGIVSKSIYLVHICLFAGQVHHTQQHLFNYILV